MGVYVGLQATEGKLRKVGQFGLAKKLPEMEDVVSTGPSCKGRHNEYSSILGLRVRVHFVLASMGLHCPVRGHGLCGQWPVVSMCRASYPSTGHGLYGQWRVGFYV